MKILHLADLHLGSKLDFAITENLRDNIKRELRNAFLKAIAYANKENIKHIILAGDIFDSDYPTEQDKRFFYDMIINNPTIDFFYLRGNHDKAKDQKIYANIDNLKTFSSEWTYYNYDNLCIAGIEMAEQNYKSYYDSLNLDKNKKNIVLLHGSIVDNLDNYVINLAKLANKHIDYLALGHIHKYTQVKGLDFIGAYPGVLVGRSFDETGPKGMIELEISSSINMKFIPVASYELLDLKFDISSYQSDYMLAVGIKEKINFKKENLYRITLIGEQNYPDLSIDSIKTYLNLDVAFITLVNKSSLKLDFTKYLEDKTIKGELVRLVQSDKNLTAREKEEILNYAFKALKGESVE